MAVYITPQSEIDKYFASESLSQSRLKTLLKGLDKFLDLQGVSDSDLYYEENKSFIKGGAVDCILTGEEGKFEELYHVSDIETKPSDVEMSIIKMMFDDIGFTQETVWRDMDLSMGTYESNLLASIEFHDWYKGKPGEKRIASLIERGEEYFSDLKRSFGKQVLDKTEYITINSIVQSLRENPKTAKYFDRERNAKVENVDFYYQLPIYFVYKGIDCKALLDLLIVFKDLDGNVVHVEPIDLKTMAGSTLQFGESLKRFRYDIQGAWYTESLLSPESSFKKLYPDDLNGKVKPFKFIVESSTDQGQPLVYELTEEVLTIGRAGRPSFDMTDLGVLFDLNEPYRPITLVKKVKGFEELVEDYNYYQKQGWIADRIIAENAGDVLKIGWEGIMSIYAD